MRQVSTRDKSGSRSVKVLPSVTVSGRAESSGASTVPVIVASRFGSSSMAWTSS